MSRTDRVLGLRAVASAATWSTRRRLRVVAYHGVSNPDAFCAQLDYLMAEFTIVSGAEVAESIEAGRELPERALWLTFDDGNRSIVDNGLPHLTRRGLAATAFICPGLIESGRGYWWAAVDAALDQGPVRFAGRRWEDRSLVTHLKTVPDEERRAFVESLPVPPSTEDPPMDRTQLSSWIDAGLEVGNHTWDHPCLPRCAPEEQRAQIVRSHQWLAELLGEPCRLFAYPNGDGGDSAREVLRELDQLVLGFDHHLVARQPDPLAISRLRLDSDAPMHRVRAIASGSHSALFEARAQLRRAKPHG